MAYAERPPKEGKLFRMGLVAALAIAIHNFPEGLAEPIGASIGYLIFFTFFSDIVFGILFASVGGIMVFVSLDELLPAAREYGEPHLAIYGLIGGMIVMALSLLLFL